MTTKEILNTTEHRPWKVPDNKWQFYQEWHNVIFVHWQVELNELKKFMPKELEIDLFEGKPWISLVAFTLKKIRPRYLPAFPPISNFDEVNFRTYIKKGDKPGIYFLSIEGGKKISCKIAKLASGLPYRYAKIKRENNQYRSANPKTQEGLEMKFAVKNPVTDKNPLDKWLTERYALFQDTRHKIREFEIHHPEWPLNNIEVEKLDINYPRFKDLIPNDPHKMHYSKGVQVLTWDKIKKSKNSL